MVAYIGEQNETVAFINDDADTAAVEEAIRSIPHVAGVEFISKDQMLDKYSQRLEGYTNLKEMFQNDNPLLANYVVRADEPANSPAWPQHTECGRRARGQLAAGHVRSVCFAAKGGYLCLLWPGHRAGHRQRGGHQQHHQNYRVQPPQGDWHMKLVGATNGFIRFPFFVEGVTSGLISALIASAIVCGGYYAVYEWYGKNPTNLTTMFGGTLLPLQDLWYYVVLGFMLFGFVLCGIGTATSIRKHLQV